MPIARATQDYDFAVRVASWEVYENLRTQLLEIEDFHPTDARHRLRVRVNGVGFLFDLVPFGEIEDGRGKLTWPPEHELEMNVAGFQAMLGAVQQVLIRANPPLELPIAPVPALILLKLFAWIDRNERTAKDAIDVLMLLENYIDTRFGDEMEGLLDRYPTLLDDGYDLAGPYLLGRELCGLCDAKHLEIVILTLNQQLEMPDQPAPLIRQMGDTLDPPDFERPVNQLTALLRGLTEHN